MRFDLPLGNRDRFRLGALDELGELAIALERIGVAAHAEQALRIAAHTASLRPPWARARRLTDWLSRARTAGHGGWYVANAVAEHPVDWDRLRLPALYRHGVASGVETIQNRKKRKRTFIGLVGGMDQIGNKSRFQRTCFSNLLLI